MTAKSGNNNSNNENRHSRNGVCTKRDQKSDLLVIYQSKII